MCGFCVWVSSRKIVDGNKLARAIKLQSHRGPDNQRLYLWDDANGIGKVYDIGDRFESERYKLGMAHARLSILDLSDASNQPMVSEDGQHVIVFNGEIYNYLEIKRELLSSGEVFRTTGDTEVLLKMLRTGGIGSLRKANGMWAFAMFSKKKQQIVLARDRYGKKPLFYYCDSDNFIAASECKSIFEILGGKRRLNLDFLSGFLVAQRWPIFDDGASLYQNIFSLQPGCCMTFDVSRHDVAIHEDNLIEDFIDNPFKLSDVNKDIESAVTLRLRSDVPIGVMVSGGVDSTVVAAHAAMNRRDKENMSFYTISTTKDDSVYSKRVAECLNVNLIEVETELDNRKLLDCLRKLVYHFEVPLNAGLIILPGYLITKKMAEDGIRVALDGTGGDEVFGGYPGDYRTIVENMLRDRKILESFLLKLRSSNRGDKGLYQYLKGWLSFLVRTAYPHKEHSRSKQSVRKSLVVKYSKFINEKRLKAIFNECYGIQDLDDMRSVQLYHLKKDMMPAYLYMNDQVAMMNSVELRSPLMDYRLIKYLTLPNGMKCSQGFCKFLLRTAIPPVVSDDVRWRKSKHGFSFLPQSLMNSVSDEMLDSVKSSYVLNTLFHLEPMIREWELKKMQVGLRTLIHHLYSVALLESIFDITV